MCSGTTEHRDNLLIKEYQYISRRNPTNLHMLSQLIDFLTSFTNPSLDIEQA